MYNLVMDSLLNPFAPGAGTPPPELAGRVELLESGHVAIGRTRLSLPTKGILMVGLRGVGKTVLLDALRQDAEAQGIHTLRIEAPEGRSLPSLIAPQLRQALLRLSRTEKARTYAKRALSALAGFAKSLKVSFSDIEVGFDEAPEPGLADNGDLEHDLQDLFLAVGEAAKRAETALILFIDELQYVDEPQLAALITAMHRLAQSRMPVLLIGAGLPQLRGRMGDAKSYAERLFDFPEVGPLSPDAVEQAIRKPLEANAVAIEDAAIGEIQRLTSGYPYFVQEWGKHAWDIAIASPITAADVAAASVSAIAAMDESFFLVRFDRLTPLEKKYLRAMAELGRGPHRSGDIADMLGRPVSSLAPTRFSLIKKGMVWSPSHGDTAFTVPLFDEFMARIIPGDEWKAG